MDHLHTWIPAPDLGMGRYRCSECPQTGYRAKDGIRPHKKVPRARGAQERTVGHTAGRRPGLDWYDYWDYEPCPYHKGFV